MSKEDPDSEKLPKIPMSLFGASSGSFDFLKSKEWWKLFGYAVFALAAVVLLIAPSNWRSPEAWLDRIVSMFQDSDAMRHHPSNPTGPR
jgi:hypothetical protein